MRSIFFSLAAFLALVTPVFPETTQTQPVPTPENTPIGDPDCPWDSALRGIGEEITAPKLLNKVDPEIPEEYKGKEIEQTIYLYEAVITAEGDVCGLRLMRNPEKPLPEFEKAVIKALLQWRFEPALKDGKPVDCIMTLTAWPEVR